MLAFDKYEGLGNDFIVVCVAEEHAISSELARRICDRRRGVGADGVLLVLPARTAGSAARMKVINADGSVPEMCGNGLRCVALSLARSASTSLVIDTDAGPRGCEVDVVEDGAANVCVDMGLVRALGSQTVALGEASITVEVGDAGNPHAILFGEFGRAEMDRLGRAISTHTAFPSGTNVEFATLTERGIDLVVFERGVGFTEACGTGACATVAVACVTEQWPYSEPCEVRLPGGPLIIRVDSGGRTAMTGPARHVFQGKYAG